MVTWTKRSVGELVDQSRGGGVQTGPFGSQLHESDYVDDSEGVAVVMPKDMLGGRVDYSSIARVTPQKARQLATHLTQTRDILLARRGDIGRCALVREADSGVMCGTGSVRVRLSEAEVLPEFLFRYLATTEGRHQLESKATGVTMPNISTEVVRSLEVRFPPLPIQATIVSILDAYDDLIENNTRRIQILEDMAQAIYREWFSEFRFPGHEDVPLVESELGLIPQGWRVARVDQIADIVRGRSYKGTELVEDGGQPLVNLKCVKRDGGFRLDGLKRYSGKFKEEQKTYPGDIVMAVTDMTQERRIVARAARVPAVFDGFAVISMDLVKVAPVSGVGSAYLLGALGYSSFPDEVKNFANGANVLHLSPERIAEYLLALPPIRLREAYDSMASDLYSLSDSLLIATTNLRATRDFLLPRLISGEVDVSDLEIDTSGLVA